MSAEGDIFGPQLPPSMAGGVEAPRLGGEEDSDFGPQLPPSTAGVDAVLVYDPDDLSLQVFDADTGGGPASAARRRRRGTAGDTEGGPIATSTRHYPGLDVGDSDNSADSDGEGAAPLLPVSHQIALSAHTKTVTSIALDRSGARMVTGGSDSDVYFWDFAGMTRELRPFRHIERPLGAYQVTKPGLTTARAKYSRAASLYTAGLNTVCLAICSRAKCSLTIYSRAENSLA
eukprot:scaffold22445_cov101-Isochrysis_galbana.AAC.1